MNCAQIILLNSFCDLDDYRNQEGALAIDIPKDIQITINKKTEELSNLDKLVSDYSNSFELLLSSREISILKSVQFEKTSSNTLIYRAYLLKDGLSLIDGYLYIDSVAERVFDSIVKVKCQIIGTHQQWKDFMRVNKLNSLELGQVVWDDANIVDLWQNNDEGFQEQQSAIYPLLSNNGGYSVNGQRLGTQGASIYDVRFNIYLKAFFDAAFCQAGYKVKSAFFNSDYFRRCSLYALQANFGTNETIQKGTLVEVESSSDSALGGGVVIPFDTVLSDITSKYDSLNYWYINNTNRRIYDLFIDLNITQNNTNLLVGTASSITMVLYDSGGTPVFPFPQGYVIPIFDRTGTGTLPALGAGEIYSAEGTVDLGQLLRDNLINEGYIEAGWYIEFRHIEQIGNQTKVDAGAFAKFYTKNSHWFEVGDIIQIGSVLDSENSIYDYLQDLKKIFNLRFNTIESQKIVEIEPAPARYKAYDNFQEAGTFVEGFEGNPNNPDDIIDITDLVDVCQYIERVFPKNQRPIYYDFKFKESSDQYKRYNLFGNANLELYQNDTGENIQNIDKKEIELKLIEPTLNDFDKDVSNVPDIAGAYIPFMWANAQDESSELLPEVGSNIAPRVMFVFGWQSQINAPDAIGLEYEGTFYSFIPNIGQLFEIPIVFPNVIDFGIPPQNIVFKDNLSLISQSKNLVNTFYQDSINQDLEIVRLKIRTKISNLFFKCLDIRKLLKIFSEEGSLMRFNSNYKLISISKDVNSDELVSIELKPKIKSDGC